VRRLAAKLPEVTSTGPDAEQERWSVRGKTFAWERPLRRGDLEALGEAAPNGPILCLRTADVDAKDALVAAEPQYFFTTPHFHGYAAVLIDLSAMPVPALQEALLDAWLTRAPKRLAAEFTG
jgi:hypothetical protein